MATDRSIKSKISNLTVTQGEEKNFSGSFHLSGSLSSLITDLAPGGNWNSDLSCMIQDKVKDSLGLDRDEEIYVDQESEDEEPIILDKGVLTLKIPFSGYVLW